MNSQKYFLIPNLQTSIHLEKQNVATFKLEIKLIFMPVIDRNDVVKYIMYFQRYQCVQRHHRESVKTTG